MWPCVRGSRSVAFALPLLLAPTSCSHQAPHEAVVPPAAIVPSTAPAPTADPPSTNAAEEAPTPVPPPIAAAPADPCEGIVPAEGASLVEEGGPKLKFSVHGYAARGLRIERTLLGATERHCVLVAWPRGRKNSDDKPVAVARHIDDGWFRAIENTLARVPWKHVLTLRRIVIDDRPKEHGIAPFDRKTTEDARDGRSIWLHEHLFRSPNHWTRGNYGTYWAYHANEDDRRLDDQPGDHQLFSPVLLHELGHLVAYNIVNGEAGSDVVPPCAKTCGDAETGCSSLTRSEREQNCISPYCLPFKFKTGTENWAEQYRFYFQGSPTRALLARAKSTCGDVLATDDVPEPPWQRGLPDMTTFRKSLWDSCNGRACKPW